jgi:tetratricopeptide (TPR) repeat protein/serine/threonine protein kinase
LITLGASLDSADKDGWTALHYAAAESRSNVVQLLLDAGARVDLATVMGKLASELACNAMVRSMIEKRENEELEARRLALIANRSLRDDKEERIGDLASRVCRAEGMLSESLRENDVLRDAVIHVSSESERISAVKEIVQSAGPWDGATDFPTVELRRLISVSCAAMSCLEEAGHHIRQTEDSSLEDAFVQFASIEMSDPPEVLSSSPFSDVVGARLMGRSVVVKRVKMNPDKAQGVHRTIFDDVAVFPVMRHPNLVTCLGVAFSPRPEIVFVREDGVTLHAMLHRSSSTIDYSLLRNKYRIIRGICDGLAFLHLQSVTHGRFSSHHVLVGVDLHPRICGFAMAKTMAAVRSGTVPVAEEHATSNNKGNEWMRWASPERLAALLGEVGGDMTKADIYSFGMVCLEICGEIEPYGDIQVEDVAQKVRSGALPYYEQDFMVPELFAALVSACLWQEPAMRPSFVSCQNYLKTLLPRLPAPTGPISESAKRSFVRELDLLRLALDRGDQIEPNSGLHAMELKGRWQWAVQQRAEDVIQRALEFGIVEFGGTVPCAIIGGVDYEKLTRNGLSPPEMFELEDLLREPAFCPVTYNQKGLCDIDRSDRILVEVYGDFGPEVGDEIVRVYEQLYIRGGISRQVVTVALDPNTSQELTASQVLSLFSKLLRSSNSDREETAAEKPASAVHMCATSAYAALFASAGSSAGAACASSPPASRPPLSSSLVVVSESSDLAAVAVENKMDEDEVRRQQLLDLEEEEHNLRNSQELETVDQLRRKAKAHTVVGEYAQGLALLKVALELDPDNLPLHVRVSALYFAYGRYRESLEHCNRAIDAHLELHSLNVRKADCLLKLGLLSEAEAVLKSCFSDEEGIAEDINERMTNIQRVRTIGKLANFLLENGRYQDVIKHVTEALVHSSDNDDLLLLQGYALIGMNEGLLAIRAAEMVLNHNSSSRGAWLVMGYAAFQCLGNLGFAVECFDRAEFGCPDPVQFRPPMFSLNVCNAIKISHNVRNTTEIAQASSLLVLNSFTIAMQIRMVHSLAVSAIEAMSCLNYADAIMLLEKGVEYGVVKKSFGGALTGTKIIQQLKLFRSALSRKENGVTEQ